MIGSYLMLLLSTIIQNASFTLVSRARNSKSLIYNGIASVLSNTIWVLVIKQVVNNLDSNSMMFTYVIGCVIGSVLMHYIAMEYFEKDRKKDNGK